MNVDEFRVWRENCRRRLRKQKKIHEQEALEFLLDEDATDLDNEISESTEILIESYERWIGW